MGQKTWIESAVNSDFKTKQNKTKNYLKVCWLCPLKSLKTGFFSRFDFFANRFPSSAVNKAQDWLLVGRGGICAMFVTMAFSIENDRGDLSLLWLSSLSDYAENLELTFWYLCFGLLKTASQLCLRKQTNNRLHEGSSSTSVACTSLWTSLVELLRRLVYFHSNLHKCETEKSQVIFFTWNLLHNHNH